MKNNKGDIVFNYAMRMLKKSGSYYDFIEDVRNRNLDLVLKNYNTIYYKNFFQWFIEICMSSKIKIKLDYHKLTKIILSFDFNNMVDEDCKDYVIDFLTYNVDEFNKFRDYCLENNINWLNKIPFNVEFNDKRFINSNCENKFQIIFDIESSYLLYNNTGNAMDRDDRKKITVDEFIAFYESLKLKSMERFKKVISGDFFNED